MLSFGKETRSPSPSALARSRFPAGDQRRFSSPLSRQRPLPAKTSPGKDLSGKRLSGKRLSGKRRDADVAGPELQPARSRLRLGSLRLPCRVCFGLTSKASPEIKTLTGISVGKLSSPGKDPWVSWWSLFPGDGKRRFAYGSLCLPRCCCGFNPQGIKTSASILVSSLQRIHHTLLEVQAEGRALARHFA